MDEADIADIYMTRNLEQSLAAARNTKATIVANGQCHSCEHPVEPNKLFCDALCREDWERVQAAQARAGGVRATALH